MRVMSHSHVRWKPQRMQAPIPAGSDAPFVRRWPSRRAILQLAAGAALVQALVYLLGLAFLERGFRLADLDAEQTVFSWTTSAVIVVAAAACLLSLARGSGWRYLWLAGLLGFLSLDESIALHERVGGLAVKFGMWVELGRLIWVLVYLPLLALILWEIWVGGGHDRGVTSIGLTLLVVAVGIEAFSWVPLMGELSLTDAPYRIGVVLEEGAELAGWICIAGGLSTMAVTRRT